MAVAFNAASAVAGGSAAASVTVNVPAGTVNGDLLVVQIGWNENATLNNPAGWTQIREDQTGAGGVAALNSRLMYRVAASEPASYTWTFASGTRRIAGCMVNLTGADTAAPIDSSSGQAQDGTSTANVTAPTVDPVVADGFLLYFGASRSGTTFTPPTGMTERYDGANGSGVTVEMATEQLASGAATGTRTGVLAAATTNGQAGQLVVIKAAGGAGPTPVRDVWGSMPI